MIKKYDSYSVESKAAFWYIVSNVFHKVVVFLCTPIYTRYLSTEQYGIYTLYQSWLAILIVFCTFCIFNSGFSVGLTKYDKHGKDYATCTVMLCLCSTVIIGSLIVITNSLIKYINLEFFFVIPMFIEIAGMCVYNFYISYQRYYFKYMGIIVISITMTIFLSLSSVCIVVFSPDNVRIYGKIYGEIMVWVIVGGVCLFKIFRNSHVIFNKEFWLFDLKNNIPLIPHYLSATILNQADRIMIASMIDNSSAGLYGLAYSISMFTTAISTAIQNAFNPYLYRKLKTKDIKDIEQIIKWLIIIVLIVCESIIMIAPEIIRIIAPSSYWGCEYVMAPIMCSVFFLYLYSVFSSVEHYYGKTIVIMVVSCICAIVNIILNYLFIPIYGYVAAGYTTLICYTIQALIHMESTCILLNKYEIRLVKRRFVILSTVMSIIVSIIISSLFKFVVIRYSLLIIIFICFFLKRNDIKRLMAQVKNGE